MQSSIAGQLRVKAEREDAVLLHSDSMAVERRDDLGGASRLNQRRPDEDTRKRLAVQARDIEGRFEAVDLASVAVALHEHRHRRALAAWEDDAIETLEIIFDLDQAGLRGDRLERTHMLGKRTLHREDPDQRSAGRTSSAPTSLWQRAALPLGWLESRARASPFPIPRRPPRARRACRNMSSRPRSPWRASRGPRT